MISKIPKGKGILGAKEILGLLYESVSRKMTLLGLAFLLSCEASWRSNSFL